jgi:hypothetical protein
MAGYVVPIFEDEEQLLNNRKTYRWLAKSSVVITTF